jgi:predicted NBD/HSP70 family sugar kinase
VNLACILAPQAIAIGGGKTKAENWDLVIRPAIDKALEYLEQHMTYSIKIMRAKLENPTLFGAYELARASLAAQPVA